MNERRSPVEVILDLIDRALAANNEWWQKPPEVEEDDPV